MTTTGFTSAVAHRDDPNMLMIRARDRESLSRLAEDLGQDAADVYSALPSDYPFRLVVSRSDYANWCHDQAMNIDYDNFKLRASQRRDDVYTDYLHCVWVAGLSLTDSETREMNTSAWSAAEQQWLQP